ncbi:MAG: Rid family detoxifying hydrolase [Bacteroidota bacterium]|nr:Rid family detoxifying hydrolase [Bacteroidota bacterium]
MKKSINIKNAPDPVGPYSQAIIHNNIMYASGQIAIDPKSGFLINDDVEKELHQILINIDALLEAAQISRKNILKCSIFLKNMDDFNVVNKIYADYFDSPFPARETVEVARLPKDVNIEISFIAAIN